MRKRILVLTSAILLTSLVSCGGGNEENFCEPVEDDDLVHLVILAGQSGARGKALVSDLTDEEKEPNENVDIITDGLTMPSLSNIPEEPSANASITELRPGFGDSGTEFGPELGIGQTLASRYPKDGESRKSVIVKYTASGSTFKSHRYSESSIDDYSVSDVLDISQIAVNPKTGNPTGPLTNNLYQLIDRAEEQLDDEGYKYVIDGCIFIHGEQDAKFDDNMSIYEEALKNWVKDLRAYVGNEKLPVVITEALTNSAKYSNELRLIQADFASSDENVYYVSNEDLYTNTFEPWHFGAESNFVLGNRATEELVKLNDTRKVESFESNSIDVPIGIETSLPKYQIAKFTNGETGYVKVDSYDSYDYTKSGSYKVNYKAKINCVEYAGSIDVNVGNYATVDGTINDKEYDDEIAFQNSKGELYFRKNDEGLFIGAKIDDDDIWTDGENWKNGDMGQKEKNDDLRIYLTDSEASNRYTLALSSASLLRVYDSGISMDDSDSTLVKNNLIYNKIVEGFKYRASTKGDVNGGVNDGLSLEMYFSFAELGFDETSDLKFVAEYSDITSDDQGTTRVETPYYVYKEGSEATSNFEKSDDAYIDLASVLG